MNLKKGEDLEDTLAIGAELIDKKPDELNFEMVLLLIVF